MTLKLHFLHFHLDELLQQLPQELDEHGERFHQITKPMETRYKGKKLDALLAEVCWWSSKISQFEDEYNEDPYLNRYEGNMDENIDENMPENLFIDPEPDDVADDADVDDNDDDDDDGQPPLRRMRLA